jgi:hypothetical protein
MKMKKVTLGCSLLLAATMFFSSCNKKKANEAPAQDMEFETSKYVTFGNNIATEIEIIASYLGENYLTTGYFTPAPGTGSLSPSYTITTDRDTTAKKLTITYTGSVTCRDGKKRNGSIVIDYSGSSTTLGAKFYRDPGFKATISLNNYWCDGWFVDDVNPITVTNNMASNYSPSTDDLNWTMSAFLSIIPEVPADSVKKIVWNGTLKKTLTNTENTSIMATNKQSPINWVRYNAAGTPTAGAMVAYTGTVTGVTKRIVSYKFEIDSEKPATALTRDFSCSPDKILGVINTPSVVTYYSEFHPFISGKAKFTSLDNGTAEPRYIDYASGEAAAPCDNSATITIKGITYNLDLMK